MAPKKFWRQILTRKTKESNKITLEDWNSYLKNIYDSLNVISNIQTLPTTEEFFSLEDMDFGIKRLAIGRAKDIEGYQVEILKIGGHVLSTHIHNLFNLVVKQGFPKPWTPSHIIPILKSGDMNNPSNCQTIMISPLLAKLYVVILEKKIIVWLESKGKRAKGQASFRMHHSTIEHLITLRVIAEECRNNKSNMFCCFVDFKKAFDTVPRNNIWNRLEELKVTFELRATAIRLYENVITKFKSIEVWLKYINCNIGVK